MYVGDMHVCSTHEICTYVRMGMHVLCIHTIDVMCNSNPLRGMKIFPVSGFAKFA